MRSRSNSGVRLDFYQRVVQRTILRYQNPVTGLLPATPGHPHAWTRDNVYSIMAVWGLALAYRKTADLDEDRAKAYELEQSVVKLMRGLLQCMMKQIKKVEQFKYSQCPTDALHAKYSVSTGETVVTDSGWGHLQIDATSLYLLILAEMTASGLQIIFTQDEVAFVQNLVFYIQAAYRIPDYGIWERGDKTNHGLPELNASSIGMAKAAMEAINELDLFGARGGPSSIIHVMADEAQQCQAILQSMLPRESVSKEVDAGLLSVIGYPGFAVNDPELIEFTRDTIIEKLEGKYGLSRFLRDGHKTAREDPNRLHYEPWELQVFEGIECEWPMFFSYLILEGIFRGDQNQVDYYSDKLDTLLIKDEHGMKLVPEMFAVPADKVETEYKHPQSTDRIAVGKLPQTWGQSLYILGRLLKEGFLSPGELDPLNRRLVTEPKPDLVVQVVILAEDRSIQEKLAYHDLKVQTIAEVSPIQVYPARVLSQIYAYLGRSKKLELSGRPSDMVGILATSRLYSIGDKIMAFMPQFFDRDQFYLVHDVAFSVDLFKTTITFLAKNWNDIGRPTFVIPLQSWHSTDHMHALHPSLVATIRKLQTGYIAGTRVQLGNLGDFLNTSCVTNLTFLMESDEPDEVGTLLASLKGGLTHHSRGVLGRSSSRGSRSSTSRIRRRNSVKGIIRRTCSIQIEAGEIPDSSETTPMSSLPTSPTPFLKNDSGGVPSFAFIGQHPHLRGEDETEGSVIQYHDEQFEGIDCDELLEQLKEVESLHEQADILHFLFMAKGPDWESYMGGKPVRVKDLLSELYEKAGHLKQWWLVRHTAGMLRKQVEGLAKSATDILVRQKQLAVGLPPEPREKTITRPLPPDELAAVIDEACGEDTSTAMLTQELLVYLAMFIKTEPKLFNEMLRLRVGLIIQVMASELARTLKCSGEVASDQLLNLSPYEMKTLLHHILSGKEFGVQSVHSQYSSSGRSLSITSKDSSSRLSQHQSPYTSGIGMDLYVTELKGIDAVGAFPMEKSGADKLQDSLETDRQGQWLRRRRLDGSLNRVPIHFYGQIWNVLGRCHGLSIAAYELPKSLTREMTPGEMKFALQVEMALNRIPQPEYRQLMVEAMMVLCLVVEHDNGKTRWHELVHVDKIVSKANEIFVYEQTQMEGDVTLCCGNPNHSNQHGQLKCGGAANICQHFYDSAPSGRYGTMTYMCKAVARFLPFPISHDGNLDCVVS